MTTLKEAIEKYRAEKEEAMKRKAIRDLNIWLDAFKLQQEAKRASGRMENH